MKHSSAISLFLFIFLIVGCQSKVSKPLSIDDIDFKTTDASEIFFKNVRQSYYDKQEIKAAGMDIFRMSDRNIEADYPLIHLAIAYNWRNDQAFLMVEPNDKIINQESFTILGIDGVKNDTLVIEYSMGNMKDQVAFAHKLYQSITSDQNLLIQINDEDEVIFDKFEDREVLRKTMLDYYKLIEVSP